MNHAEIYQRPALSGLKRDATTQYPAPPCPAPVVSLAATPYGNAAVAVMSHAFSSFACGKLSRGSFYL
ncbi:hypothetical protein E2C01_076201 [Portunus trituberculatus]|uniref:Uncharacterized protein n=1 Tax=Portunus trituberculatus TaxID=210409 RepID=A0A5B7IHX9_PORTR|nr:hypothetical protein [Portunus trituberculatus]